MRRNKEQNKWGLPHEAMRLCFKWKNPQNLAEVLGGGTPLFASKTKKGHPCGCPFRLGADYKQYFALLRKTAPSLLTQTSRKNALLRFCWGLIRALSRESPAIQSPKEKPYHLARRAKGQFCKNTVYFVRDIPYSCFLGLTRFYEFLPSFQGVPFHQECRSDRQR